MLNLHARPLITRALDPIVERLARSRVTPDAVTVTGTIGSCAAAAGLLATGHFILGPLVTTLFILTDLFDGQLARKRGGGSVWGAFLDSSMDRIADGFAFGSLTYWYATGGRSHIMVAVSLVVLGSGQVTSYVKARAEGVGLSANVGLFERAERLIIPGVLFLLQGITRLHWLGAVALWVLAVGSVFTVYQRLVEVHRQAVAAGVDKPSVAEPLTPAR